MHSRFRNSLPDIYEDGVYMRVHHTNRKPVLVSVSSQGTIKAANASAALWRLGPEDKSSRRDRMEKTLNV